ncbi:MAG: DUF3786 domain-containing protein [Eubacteriales bacterium]|nr:DUF3786 domain-containing protein [Eubacteriales bacterium]
MEENRAFEEMRISAVKRLENRDCREIGENVGASFDGEKLRINSLGQEIWVDIHSWETSPRLGEWHTLTLLHYLDMGDGVPLSSQLISFGELKDGMVRGTKFDHRMEQELAALLRGRTPRELEDACRALGASLLETRADLTAVFPFFPNYPVTVNIWFEDEEFPPSGKMLLNKSADHYLTVEDAVTVGEILMGKLGDEILREG